MYINIDLLHKQNQLLKCMRTSFSDVMTHLSYLGSTSLSTVKAMQRRVPAPTITSCLQTMRSASVTPVCMTEDGLFQTVASTCLMHGQRKFVFVFAWYMDLPPSSK